jgi:UPF0716 family protein affecting phage T7 exclusion
MQAHGYLGGIALVGVIIITAIGGTAALAASQDAAADGSVASDLEPAQESVANLFPYAVWIAAGLALFGLTSGVAALSYKTGLIGNSPGGITR